MTEKCFNPDIYNLATAAGATSCHHDSGVCFTRHEFEDFMTRYVRYLQKRQEDIVSDVKNTNRFMGNDAPSWLLIHDLENSLFGEKE